MHLKKEQISTIKANRSLKKDNKPSTESIFFIYEILCIIIFYCSTATLNYNVIITIIAIMLNDYLSSIESICMSCDPTLRGMCNHLVHLRLQI